MPEGSRAVHNGMVQFDHVYNRTDPRGYFQAMGALGYVAPEHGKRFFSALVPRLQQHLDGRAVVILDLCCSYGVNAALLNHNLTLQALYDRYQSPEIAALSTESLVAVDRDFYRDHRNSDQVRVIGVDIAEQAVAYAQRVGLLWEGSSQNLEIEETSSELALQLADVSLVTVTGGISFISGRTFDRLLRHIRSKDGCWVAAFALRWTPYEPIAETLAHYGLVTERLDAFTFRQRRFADDTERRYVLEQLTCMGIDPDGKEADGWYHTNLYISGPATHSSLTIADLLSTAFTDVATTRLR